MESINSYIDDLDDFPIEEVELELEIGFEYTKQV